MRTTLIAAIVCVSSLGTTTASNAQAAIREPTSIPPQKLESALQSFAKERGRQIIFRSTLVKDLHTSGVSGELDCDEALNRLLRGTGLTYRYLGEDAVTIVPIATAPANDQPELRSGASSDAASSRSGAMSDANEARAGWFSRIRLAQANPDRPSGGRTASDAQPLQPYEPRLEEVIVTGTNLRGVAPESSPVIVFTRKDIEAGGHTTVEQFLRSVPQNFSGGANQENFNVTFAGADVTEQGAGVNLRGLGQRATLVLVNGRRMAPSGYAGKNVDISLIPISVVERIEVLTNGASAIYGSDAVGGVVNFILRDDFSGVETLLHVASATDGDGDQRLLAQTAGWTWESGHALLAYEYRTEDEVLAADREFTVRGGIPPDSYFLPRERRHSIYTSLGQQVTERLSVDLTGSYSTRDTQRDFIPSSSPLLVAADAESDVYSLGGDVTYELGDLWRVQGSATFSRNEARSSQFQSGGTGLINDGDFVNEIGEAGVKIDGDLYELAAGAVKLAFGIQYRREEHDSSFITAGQISTGRPATTRSVGRTSRAAFAELLVPLVSSANRLAGVEHLELSIAARHERYSDFGDATDPKLGLLWSPLPGLSVRGTYGTSFRAPLLTETVGGFNSYYWPNTASLYASSNDPLQGVGVVLRVLGYNPGIGPETSETWTGGIVLRPESLRGFTATMDYFSTEYSDRITLPSPTIAQMIGNPAYSAIVYRNPPVELVNALLDGADDVVDVTGPGFTDGGSVPSDVTIVLDTRVANSAVSKTSGLDVGLDYDFRTGAHQFGLRANMTWLFSFDEQLTPTSVPVEALDQPYRPISLRANAGMSWMRGGWSSDLVLSYVDSYADRRYNPVRAVDSFEYLDLNLAYRFGHSAPALLQRTRVALSVLNLLDTAPPALSADPGAPRGLGYDPVNASGRGRFVGLQVRKQWGGEAGGRE